jgi:hypothetical protein
MADEWVWLCRACVYSEDHRHVVGYVARDSICARCGGLASEVFMRACQDPRPAVTPPAYVASMEFTPSTVLERYQPIVWDVNGYYADLGIKPTATRREIMQAYQVLGGQDSVRLTYVVKQLLDADIRARYDATPLGSVFFDHYVMRRVLDEIIQEVTAARLAAGEEVDEASLFEEFNLDDLLNARSFEVVDTAAPGVDNRGFETCLGHYLWQSNRRHGRAQWTSLLSQAFTEQGERDRIAVGFHRTPEVPVVVTRWDNRTVVFLHEGEVPTIDLARQAVEQYRALRGSSTSTCGPEGPIATESRFQNVYEHHDPRLRIP